MRFFNAAGPVNWEDHYCLPPPKRFDMQEIEMLLVQKKYFVLHAPRQTGKTSSLLALMEHLNREGQYKAVYCNVDAVQADRENVEQAMNDIVRELGAMARIYLKDKFIETEVDTLLEQHTDDTGQEFTS